MNGFVNVLWSAETSRHSCQPTAPMENYEHKVIKTCFD